MSRGNMSVSDNSTIAPSSDIEGSLRSLDEAVVKKNRRLRRPLRPGAQISGSANDSELFQEQDDSSASTPRSPYADAEIVVLQVGAKSSPFSVHGHYFAKSAVLAAKYDPFSLAEHHVSLPEIDEVTAHALVHFLYTERYDDLLATSRSTPSTVDSYRLGTCVYCASVRYELPDLAELAKEKITSLSDEVAISDVLLVAKEDAFRLLPEDEIWYSSYLESAVQSAMAKDPEPFRRPDFITQIEGNTRLLQVVWKTMMSNFTQAPVTAHVPGAPDEALPAPPADAEVFACKVTPAAVPVDEHKAQVEPGESHDPQVEMKEPPSDSAEHEMPDTTTNADTADIIDAPADAILEIEGTIGRTRPLESVTNELDDESSREPGANLLPSPCEEPEQPDHKRSDSVMHLEGRVISPADDERDRIDGSEDNVHVKVSGAIEGTPSQKKSKKGKKKKSSISF